MKASLALDGLSEEITGLPTPDASPYSTRRPTEEENKDKLKLIVQNAIRNKNVRKKVGENSVLEELHSFLTNTPDNEC